MAVIGTMIRRTPCAAWLATVLAVVGLAAVAAGTAAAATRGVVINRVSVTDAAAAPGASLHVRVKLRNPGRSAASAVSARFFLATSSRHRTSDYALGARRVERLAAGRSRSQSVTVAVPASARTGPYFLLACVAARRKLSCTASAGRVWIGLLHAPNPRTVSAQLDASDAVTQTVGTSGDTLTATAPNGTRFTLVIPDGALGTDTAITMTPIASIGGLPFRGGLVGGVQLAPEGLQLQKPATLTIEPTGTVPASQRTTFTYTGSGQDFSLYPDLGTGSASLRLTHFSGYGEAKGTPGERAQQKQHSGSSAQEQAQQDIGSILDDARSKGEDVGDPKVTEQIRQALQQWFNASVMPDLKAAQTDDSNWTAAVSEALSWLYDVQLLGQEGAFSAQTSKLNTALGYVLDNAYNKARQRCTSDHDPNQALIAWEIARRADLLGVGNLGSDAAFSAFERCLIFKLNVDAVFTNVLTGQNGHGDNLLSDVHIQVSDLTIQLPSEWTQMTHPVLTGSATPQIAGFSVNYKCAYTWAPQAADPFTVTLTLKTNIDWVRLKSIGPAMVDSLTFDPGGASIKVTGDDDPGPDGCTASDYVNYNPVYYNSWTRHYQGTNEVKDFTYSGGGGYEKTISDTHTDTNDPATTSYQQTTWRLQHTPSG